LGGKGGQTAGRVANLTHLLVEIGLAKELLRKLADRQLFSVGHALAPKDA
jgi:hypothetical protein